MICYGSMSAFKEKCFTLNEPIPLIPREEKMDGVRTVKQRSPILMKIGFKEVTWVKWKKLANECYEAFRKVLS